MASLTALVPHDRDRHPAGAALQAILSRPAESLDYARAKLAIDRLVDPTVDSDRASIDLDRLAAEALRLAGPSAGANARLAALRRLIYEPGAWNAERPFAYDHGDPLGQDIRNMLLPVYLATRRGNCVSMPILFLILAERIGLDVALATAPLHMFVRWRDESGGTLNLETTSGAHPARDAWFRENMPMSERALANGLYMRSLGRREAVAAMAGLLLDHLLGEARYDDAIQVADVILAHAPSDVYAMLKKATACGHIIRTEFQARYPIPFQIPLPRRPRYLALQRSNDALFAAAEALGWQPEDEPAKDLQERKARCS